MNRKIISLLLCIALLALPLSGCSSADTEPANEEVASTITITDDNDNVIILPSDINRVVVTDIYPFASILTIFLGSAEKLVGIHPVCMSAAKSGLLSELFPEILNADTSFMTSNNLNIEQLLKLNPDVVFYGANNHTLGDTLTKAGIAAVAVSPSKWDCDVIETYDQWVSMLSKIFPERAEISEKVSTYSKEVYDSIQKTVSKIEDTDKKKILFLFKYDKATMITSGKKFFGQYWCDAVGGINVGEVIEEGNSIAAINMEQVYEWNPDVIFITNFTSSQPEDLYNNKIGGDDWSSVTAVKNGEVYKLPLGSYRGFTPGADTPVILLWMAQKVYPKLFANVDMVKQVKDYYMNLYGVELTDEQVNRMYNPSRDGAAGF
ncbi:MAG: ABC transporter substrate-binding protein [Peptostreptococcaceae bacterium]|nr:ABC transporter substrate-binding protein [Peptostreptococcaceae bacterium]